MSLYKLVPSLFFFREKLTSVLHVQDVKDVRNRFAYPVVVRTGRDPDAGYIEWEKIE